MNPLESGFLKLRINPANSTPISFFASPISLSELLSPFEDLESLTVFEETGSLVIVARFLQLASVGLACTFYDKSLFNDIANLTAKQLSEGEAKLMVKHAFDGQKTCMSDSSETSPGSDLSFFDDCHLNRNFSAGLPTTNNGGLPQPASCFNLERDLSQSLPNSVNLSDSPHSGPTASTQHSPDRPWTLGINLLQNTPLEDYDRKLQTVYTTFAQKSTFASKSSDERLQKRDAMVSYEDTTCFFQTAVEVANFFSAFGAVSRVSLDLSHASINAEFPSETALKSVIEQQVFKTLRKALKLESKRCSSTKLYPPSAFTRESKKPQLQILDLCAEKWLGRWPSGQPISKRLLVKTSCPACQWSEQLKHALTDFIWNVRPSLNMQQIGTERSSDRVLTSYRCQYDDETNALLAFVKLNFREMEGAVVCAQFW